MSRIEPHIVERMACGSMNMACGSIHTWAAATYQAGKELLRGLPVPEGSHVRFDEAGESCATPSAHRTLLRGVPAPTGAHLRFD